MIKLWYDKEHHINKWTVEFLTYNRFSNKQGILGINTPKTNYPGPREKLILTYE